MVIGANPTDAHPVFASRMKKRLREGAKADRHRPAPDRSRAHAACGSGLSTCRYGRAPTSPSSPHWRTSSSPRAWSTRAFVRERCDWEEFSDWAAFVAEPRNSPEEVAKISGVPAQTIRGAARLYASGGNGAISYGLGVTEHSQSSTTVMAIANLAMATGNIGRPGVGVNPLRGQNNVQGSCDMGSFPHELSGYRHVANDATRALFEALWQKPIDKEPGVAHPQHAGCRGRGLVQGSLRAGRGHSAVGPRHPPCFRRSCRHGMRRRAGPVPERNGELRARVSARLNLPGKGRHLHQCGTTHPAGAQGDGAEEWL